MDESHAVVDQPYLTVKELALRWRKTPNAIRIMRHRRCGPLSFKIGNQVLFLLSSVEAHEKGLQAADSRSNTDLDPTAKPVEMRGPRRRPSAA